MQKIDKILNKNNFTKEDLLYLFNVSEKENIKKIYNKAYDIKTNYVGNTVYFRGIIEFSNICEKDCLYCGIRKSNDNTDRFFIDEDEIVETAVWAYQSDYGSILLQSGERTDQKFIDFIERVLNKIKARTDGGLGITLSIGEQDYKTYKKWFKAGAHRYLLRIETSNKNLYKKIHPVDHSYEKRLDSLKYLQDIGYQVGTGVMIGLPFQTYEDLVNDIKFYQDFDIDMIGMGPYVKHENTPLIKEVRNYDPKKQLELSLKMVAITRIIMKDINIAATTAMQALNPIGREMAIEAGANIIMPNVTNKKYRGNYQLYDNKPCVDEDSDECKDCLKNRIESIGEKIGYNKWGDSIHYFKRVDDKKAKGQIIDKV